MDPEEQQERVKALEKMLEQTLEEGKDREAEEDVQERARKRLLAMYEYRIQSERDPIAEETKIIRSMAKEPDGRYDKYVQEKPTDHGEKGV
jgi:ElaB/YqjD/DUF883 family membrane-anchored ribosome-binding protein